MKTFGLPLVHNQEVFFMPKCFVNTTASVKNNEQNIQGGATRLFLLMIKNGAHFIANKKAICIDGFFIKKWI